MPSKKLTLPAEAIDDMIWDIRGVRVILDSDLAAIYGVVTKRLNEQFQRNRKRFPEDFAFQLTADEVTNLRPVRAVVAAKPIVRGLSLSMGRSKRRT